MLALEPAHPPIFFNDMGKKFGFEFLKQPASYTLENVSRQFQQLNSLWRTLPLCISHMSLEVEFWWRLIFFFFFLSPLDVFAFLKLPPLAQPPLQSYSASESLVAMRWTGAWLELLPHRLHGTVHSSLFGKNSAGKKFTAIPAQRKHLWNVSANVRGR